MKVVFLDIDGVLNDSDFLKPLDRELREKTPEIDIDPLRVELVNNICERTGAVIVLSTTWRELYPEGDANKPSCRSLLIKQGLRASIIGETPRTFSAHRAHEISMWLDDNDVESYVVIDDDDTIEVFGNKAVRTEFYCGDGLTKELAERAVEILGER
jgi:hypothetical protein